MAVMWLVNFNTTYLWENDSVLLPPTKMQRMLGSLVLHKVTQPVRASNSCQPLSVPFVFDIHCNLPDQVSEAQSESVTNFYKSAAQKPEKEACSERSLKHLPLWRLDGSWRPQVTILRGLPWQHTGEPLTRARGWGGRLKKGLMEPDGTWN